MEPPVIVLRNVSKKYRLFDSPRDRLMEALHPFGKRYHKEFWALNGVDLAIPRGETLGILGRNGSGKSTLLQLIAGIMQPTGGNVAVNGRMAALLELGAGFNPEFTGRENVTFQGQVMGLSAAQTRDLIPSVERFADIGHFFDQPVKIYSTGMFVRLAFAVASSVNPEILIVDEALAVGDVRFQRKCLMRIEEIRAKGATVIFVSHSLDAITSLCTRAVILENGRIVADGEPRKLVEQYLDILFSEPHANAQQGTYTPEPVNDTGYSGSTGSDRHPFFTDGHESVGCMLTRRRGFNRHELRTCNGTAEIADFLIVVDGQSDVNIVSSGADVKVFVKVRFHADVEHPVVGFELKTDKGVTLAGANTFLGKVRLQPVQAGELKIYGIGFKMPLNQGDYFLDLGIARVDGSPGGDVLDVRRSVIHMAVERIMERAFNGVVDIGFGIEEVCG